MREIFDRYLNYRYQRAGAVTPGQKMEVIRELQGEAQRGSVPIDERSVATLDTSDPSVQAVLRGESVSMGFGSAPKRRQASSNLGQAETRKKVAILVASFFIPVFMVLLYLGFRARGRAQAAEQETITQAAATNDVMLLIGMTQTQIAASASMLPEETATPTLAVATPTQDSVLYAPVAGAAAQAQIDPASIELGGRLFILQEGKVDKKTGLWNPTQPEWLTETELRKVFALPRSYLENAGVVPGGHILVRLRNGELVDYVITTILRIPLNQIEVLSANRPSVVVLTIDENQGQAPELERLVVLGEVPVPEQPQELLVPQPLSASIRAGVEGDGARLRAEPSLKAEVINLLKVDTVISVPFPLQRVDEDGLTWVYVHTATGSGWLAEDLIIYRP